MSEPANTNVWADASAGDDIADEVLRLSADDIKTRARLLENEIKVRRLVASDAATQVTVVLWCIR